MRTFHPPPPPPLASITFQGCGPAGLSLSAELASRGVRVGLIGPDHGFVNTYGVWADELEKLDLGDTFERVYPSSVCYYGDQKSTMNAPTRVSRRYARVDKAKLRAKLLRRCEDSGNVQYSPGLVATSRPSDRSKLTSVPVAARTTLTAAATVATVAATTDKGRI